MFGEGRSRDLNLREYDRLMRSLKYEEQKLKNWISRIDTRRKELAARTELYKRRNQLIRAGIYARELKNLNALRDVLYLMYLRFLAVLERLSTLKIVLVAVFNLKPLMKALTDLYPVITSLPANAEDTMKQLFTSYGDLVRFVSPPDAQIRFDLESPEATEILREAEAWVRNELSRRFPDVLAMEEEEGRLSDRVGHIIEALAADGGVHGRPKTKAPSESGKEEKLKEKVLQIVRSDGKADAMAIARRLNVPTRRVVEVLYELADEGRLRFG